MNRLQRYWWNFLTAVVLFWKWTAVFFILSVAIWIVLRLLKPPNILEGIAWLVLLVGFYWKVGANLWDTLPLTEEEIRKKRNGGLSEKARRQRGVGVPGYCHNCQVSVSPKNIDENGMHKKCGESVRVGKTTDDDWFWDPIWDDEW